MQRELFGKRREYEEKVLSAVLAATMVAGMMGNVVSVSAEEKYDLTLYSVNTTTRILMTGFKCRGGNGLNINVIAARQADTSAEDYNDSF